MQDFDILEQFVSKFERCREINEFEMKFDFEEFKASNQDVESIKKELDKYAKWEGEIQ